MHALCVVSQHKVSYFPTWYLIKGTFIETEHGIQPHLRDPLVDYSASSLLAHRPHTFAYLDLFYA